MEVKGNFINYGDYIDVHGNEIVNLTVGNGDVKIENKQAHFPSCLTYSQGDATLKFLKENEFVPEDTEPTDFLYQMGCSGDCPADVKPIVWLKNKQLLREMLELWFKPLLDEKSFKKAKMEAICPNVFIDKKGESIALAKNKQVGQEDSDKLSTFFATL